MHRSPIRHILGIATAVILPLALSVALAGQDKQPDTTILKGAPIGGVKLSHKAHTSTYGAKCENCHHASKPERPLKTANQSCMDCHTKAVAAPMKTNTRSAFHDPMAKSGVCVDCHAAPANKGKKVPAKCADCHKKENG